MRIGAGVIRACGRGEDSEKGGFAAKDGRILIVERVHRGGPEKRTDPADIDRLIVAPSRQGRTEVLVSELCWRPVLTLKRLQFTSCAPTRQTSVNRFSHPVAVTLSQCAGGRGSRAGRRRRGVGIQSMKFTTGGPSLPCCSDPHAPNSNSTWRNAATCRRGPRRRHAWNSAPATTPRANWHSDTVARRRHGTATGRPIRGAISQANSASDVVKIGNDAPLKKKQLSGTSPSEINIHGDLRIAGILGARDNAIGVAWNPRRRLYQCRSRRLSYSSGSPSRWVDWDHNRQRHKLGRRCPLAAM